MIWPKLENIESLFGINQLISFKNKEAAACLGKTFYSEHFPYMDIMRCEQVPCSGVDVHYGLLGL